MRLCGNFLDFRINISCKIFQNEYSEKKENSADFADLVGAQELFRRKLEKLPICERYFL